MPHPFPFQSCAGLSLKTSPETAQLDIPKLWGDWHQVQLQDILEFFDTSSTLCLYHSYEGDFRHPYTVTIGYPLKKQSTPEFLEKVKAKGLDVLTFPTESECRYEEFKTALNTDFPLNLVAEWNKIWNRSDLPRAYLIDFDLYGPTFNVDKNPSIFLSLKK